MRDPYLTAIIESVERGGDPVMISVALNSGAIATGFVRQSRHFVKLARRDPEAVDRQRAEAKWLKEKPPSEAERHDTLFRNAVPGDDPDGITLSDVTMVWHTGDGVKLLTLRVNVGAISAWWLGGGQPITGKRDSGGFWAISLPIG